MRCPMAHLARSRVSRFRFGQSVLSPFLCGMEDTLALSAASKRSNQVRQSDVGAKERLRKQERAAAAGGNLERGSRQRK